MPSQNKTEHLGLNQWDGNEYPKRVDFVDDNLKIDTAVKSLSDQIETKVDKVTGKGLSTEDFTSAEKNKLLGIEDNANKYIHPSSHPATMITQDSSHRFVSDTEKSTWNGKVDQSDFDIVSAQMAELAHDINNLTHTNLQQALEILDLKMQLEEQSLINFINKTGVGFYDLFDTTDNIDTVNTDATVNTTDKKVEFLPKENYTVKSVGAFTNVTDIKVDGKVAVGDQINNIKVNSVTSQEEVTTNTVTDATVVNALFTTSKNARPQVLDNGWLVSGVVDTSNNIQLYKSDNNGATWNLFHTSSGSVQTRYGFALASDGINIHVFTTYTISGSNCITGHYSVSQSGTRSNIANFDTWINGTTAVGSCSLAISPDKTTLWATWASKNSTFPNSFNIRACKGEIQTDGSVVWGNVEQVTNANTSGADNISPTITCRQDGLSVVAYSASGTANKAMVCKLWDGSSWISLANITSGDTYEKLSPDLVVDKNGALLCCWHGYDSTDTSNLNIHFAKSTDDGATWIHEKITSGSTDTRQSPTITVDANNNIIILLNGRNSGETYNKIIKMVNNGSGWNTPTFVTSSLSSHHINVSAFYDNTFSTDFSQPLFIYQDSGVKVSFYGTWDFVKEQFYPVLDSPITTVDGEILNVIPNPFRTLQFNQETFDTFADMDLNLYPEKINKVTIQGAVTNSTSVTTGAVDRELIVGDKLFINNAENPITVLTGNFTTVDRTTPTTVINQAYDTSGNGGRKLVTLENGWLVCVLHDTTNGRHIFMVSKDNGANWEQLCYQTTTTVSTGYAITSIGNKIYTLYSGMFENTVIDATIVGNVDIGRGQSINTTFTLTAIDPRATIIANTSETEMHVAVSAKSSTHPNSFNIFYAKGTINPGGSVTWGSVEQITTFNNVSIQATNPSIGLDGNKEPFIVNRRSSTNGNFLIDFRSNAINNWSTVILIQSVTNHIQSFPKTITQQFGSNAGRIWVAWHGKDITDSNVFNINVSYSDNGGVTWSVKEKLTSGNTYHQYLASMCEDKNGKVFLVWTGVDPTISTIQTQIRIIYFDSIWGSISTITNYTTGSPQHPSTLSNYYDFEQPLFVWQDLQNISVKFYGKWAVGEGYNLTLTNPVTLADAEQVPVVDFSVEQNTSPLTLKDIDAEKYKFEKTGLNTTTSDIKVNGKENNLNSMVYAVS